MAESLERAEEKALRDAVLMGSTEAWEVLYERHHQAVRIFVRLHHGQDSSWDDLVQETWMVAVKNLKRFDPDRGSFAGWLRGIAWRVISERRRREGRPAGLPLSDLASPLPEIALQERVALALATLSPAHRMILQASYVERRTQGELSTLLGRTPKAVESLLGRAREAFKAAYRRIGDHHDR